MVFVLTILAIVVFLSGVAHNKHLDRIATALETLAGTVLIAAGQVTTEDDKTRYPMSEVHTAEHESKCAACGETIAAGDEIVLDPDDEWIHVDCEDS